MKKFNIDAYEEKLKKNPEYEGYTEKDGTEISEYYRLRPDATTDAFDRKQVETYTRIESRPDAYRTAYLFNREGNLISVAHYFSTALEIGIWQQFDSTGKLTGETDKDKEYPFALKDVIEFGKKHQVDFSKTGRVRRGYDSVYKANVWNLRWTVDEKVPEPYQQLFTLDGTTGKVLEEKKEGPPRRL
ncbi:hypothetical protein [Niabella beijingensis]|uniref:hypothetical protein n=1 Tax=Niabella beijingensis TaxID=2872700 RepID=UPI001CBCADB7|nr:hypothetical protein [Niabella beijingensis]MBZ4188640.1 hypothetical protein [Niabella beijingensis]